MTASGDATRARRQRPTVAHAVRATVPAADTSVDTHAQPDSKHLAAPQKQGSHGQQTKNNGKET